MTSAGVSVPDDLVLVGYVAGAYGIQGWVRIKPYSSNADALLNAKTWWLDKPELRDVEMLQSRNHSGDVVARLMGIEDRSAAEKLKGATVQVRRSHFPALDDGEYYWVDLIGLAVENQRGEVIGTVAGLMENGVHPILQVALVSAAQMQEPRQEDGKGSAEILIPFVDQYVKTVDLQQKKVTVDWELDY